MEILTLAAPPSTAGCELKDKIVVAPVLYFRFLEGILHRREETFTKKTRNKKTREGKDMLLIYSNVFFEKFPEPIGL